MFSWVTILDKCLPFCKLSKAIKCNKSKWYLYEDKATFDFTPKFRFDFLVCTRPYWKYCTLINIKIVSFNKLCESVYNENIVLMRKKLNISCISNVLNHNKGTWHHRLYDQWNSKYYSEECQIDLINIALTFSDQNRKWKMESLTVQRHNFIKILIHHF